MYSYNFRYLDGCVSAPGTDSGRSENSDVPVFYFAVTG